MTKEKITYEQIIAMDLPNIIVYAIPFMAFFVFLELGISFYKKQQKYDGKDTIAATCVGLGNVLISALTKFITFSIILFVYNMVPWSIPVTWWTFILCLVWVDFWRYWAHRIAHENRFWWATHVTHHSSEKYNFSTSFRLGWTQIIKIIFFLPIALVGFHPFQFFICHQIVVLYQFWLHTEYIRKLPRPIEYIFTTPSHHRVHHGRDKEYLDKNYGSTFIIWDRMFGTFQPEKHRPDYGITTPVGSYNPITLVFHEWRDIVRDIRNSKSFKEAYTLTFTSPAKYEQRKKEFEAQKKHQL